MSILRIIRFLFYALFFLVPLVLWNETSELFEFNKMWLTFIITIIIGVFWFTKMIKQRKIIFRKTPLDIPISLFLISQIISTIFSIDRHVSFWGYYGRWNGGLLSIISYIFLYYAFVSNIFNENKKETATIKNSQNTKLTYSNEKQTQSWQFIKNILNISLFSGLLVSLWGLPSHFGYDPTCFLFRGQLDVSCWTSDFQPKIRIFSTLGQPDWLAAYLAILIPLALFFALSNFQIFYNFKKQAKINLKSLLSAFYYFALVILFFLSSIFTSSKSGFLGIILEIGVFWFLIFLKNKLNKFIIASFISSTLILILIIFFTGSPFPQLNKFTYSGIITNLTKVKSTNNLNKTIIFNAGELGGTDSGKIRLFVWQGALKAWLAHPVFGTGVETFAFTYYLYRPKGHNLTSEWDFLYNKAHNEYLNYLSNTGAFGLLSYLSIIFIFLFLIFKQINTKNDLNNQSLFIALISSYVGILITNFFGFSVVIVNLYFFLIPALFFIIMDKEDYKIKKPDSKNSSTQIFAITIIFIAGFYLIAILINYWIADTNYAYGKNLDQASASNKAYSYLKNAVSQRPGEPVFQDELSINEINLALLETQNKNLTIANSLAKDSVSLSDNLIQTYPRNVVFWKSRVKIFYTLSEIDKRYLRYALDAIQHVSLLAPTDAKVFYNLGVLYAQNNEINKSILTLKKTIYLKKDYTDAYFALALVYRSKATNKNGKIINLKYEEKAVYYLDYILKYIAPGDEQVIKTLKTWQ